MKRGTKQECMSTSKTAEKCQTFQGKNNKNDFRVVQKSEHTWAALGSSIKGRSQACQLVNRIIWPSNEVLRYSTAGDKFMTCNSHAFHVALMFSKACLLCMGVLSYSRGICHNFSETSRTFAEPSCLLETELNPPEPLGTFFETFLEP